MEHASSYVLDYDVSDEEYISDSELEQGMWMSDDEAELELPPSPTASSPSLLPKASANIRQSDSESSDEDNSSQQGDNSRREPAYAQLAFPLPHQQQQVNETEKSFEGSPGKYAKLADLQRQSGDEASGRATTSKSKKQKSASTSCKSTSQPLATPLAPPPPPPPLPALIKPVRGIIKSVPLKKQKKSRGVHWDKSYRSKKNEAGNSSSKASSRRNRIRRQDTNILAVKFNTLTEPSNVHTGDAQFCSNDNCGAIVSHFSKLVDTDEEETKVWNCEFCGTRNEVDLVPEEIPTEEDTTYLLTTAAAQASKEGHTEAISAEESLVVFCIDTSGSMCVTTEVAGHHVLRGAVEKKEKLIRSLPTDLDVNIRRQELQFMPGQRRDTTWISRMESVQAAVDTQISSLAHNQPNKRVCLITFSNDVMFVGDGLAQSVTIAGDKLLNSELLAKIAKEQSLPAAIRKTHKALSKKIFSLEESGQTALGPALLVSIITAAKVPGSKVIICTDGLANVGLGSLDDVKDDTRYAQVQSFYEDLGTLAMEKGVVVSLVSIRGQECRAAELGQVATRTGGQVNIVDPHTLTDEFTSILANPVLATDTIARIILHKGLYFRHEEESKYSVIVQQVGNVTADTELTFEYGVRTKPSKIKPKAVKEEASAATAVDESKGSNAAPLFIDEKPHLPFQLQIEYTSLEGDRCLRVITQAKPVTKDRDVAEKDMDVGVVGSHIARQTASLAMQGEFTKARVQSMSAQRMIHDQSRSSSQKRWEYANFCENIIPIENELCRMQNEEQETYGRNISDGEEEYAVQSEISRLSLYKKPSHSSHSRLHSSAATAPPLKPKTKKSKAVYRRRDMSDRLSEEMYHISHSSTAQFRLPSALSKPQKSSKGRRIDEDGDKDDKKEH